MNYAMTVEALRSMDFRASDALLVGDNSEFTVHGYRSSSSRSADWPVFSSRYLTMTGV